jgi:hypothetical protein
VSAFANWDVKGFPAGSDAIGLGDVDLKFLWNPEALGFSYGKEETMSGSVLLGTDFVLPTATDDALVGNALLLAPGKIAYIKTLWPENQAPWFRVGVASTG